MALKPPPALNDDFVASLNEICGEEHVSTSEVDRLAYSRDMWPRSLLRQRSGAFDHPPAVVVHPADEDQVARIVQAASAAGVPIIPFGAGSGVCGGTLPIRGGAILDLKRMNRIRSIEATDSLLDVEAGAIGEVLERELNRRGWTLGHFPSSILCSTVGGWLAGRSAGQCSSRYGKIEDMCRQLTWVDAAGSLQQTPFLPPGYGDAAIDNLLLGSEGTLGIITSAKLVLRPLPEGRWFGGFRLPDVEAGVRAMRDMLRLGLRPSVLRLYDEFDTLIAKTGSKSDLPEEQVTEGILGELSRRVSGSLSVVLRRSLRHVLMAPRLLNRVADLIPGGCLLVVVAEGCQAERDLARDLIGMVCLDHKAIDLGEAPARHWWEHRYSVSYKQSPIFAAGGFVDTMEVAATWDRIPSLYRAVKHSLAGHCFVMAHFSHAYRDGGSIYFSFAGAARDDAAAAALYDRIWETAQTAVLAEGGVISHHHGVGLSKARYLVRQLGEAVALGDAVKRAFDRQGLLNPGKLGQSIGGGEP